MHPTCGGWIKQAADEHDNHSEGKSSTDSSISDASELTTSNDHRVAIQL